MTTLVNFAYICRKTIGGPWIGRGVPMRNARVQVQKSGESPDGRGYSVSQARWWFFSTSSPPRRSARSPRQDHSGLEKGTTILIAKPVESRLVWVFVLVTTLVSFAYLCRARIGGPWIGQGVPLRDARRASPQVGRGCRWTRMQCLSSLMMMMIFFDQQSTKKISIKRLVRTVQARRRGQPYSLPNL